MQLGNSAWWVQPPAFTNGTYVLKHLPAFLETGWNFGFVQPHGLPPRFKGLNGDHTMLASLGWLLTAILGCWQQDKWLGKSSTLWLPWQGQQGWASKTNSLVHQNHCHAPLVLAGIPWWISLQAVKVSSASGPPASCCHRDNRTCKKCATHAQTSQSSLHGMKCFSLPGGGGTAQITPSDSADGICQSLSASRSTQVTANLALKAPSSCTTKHFHPLQFG